MKNRNLPPFEGTRPDRYDDERKPPARVAPAHGAIAATTTTTLSPTRGSSNFRYHEGSHVIRPSLPSRPKSSPPEVPDQFFQSVNDCNDVDKSKYARKFQMEHASPRDLDFRGRGRAVATQSTPIDPSPRPHPRCVDTSLHKRKVLLEYASIEEPFPARPGGSRSTAVVINNQVATPGAQAVPGFLRDACVDCDDEFLTDEMENDDTEGNALTSPNSFHFVEAHLVQEDIPSLRLQEAVVFAVKIKWYKRPSYLLVLFAVVTAIGVTVTTTVVLLQRSPGTSPPSESPTSASPTMSPNDQMLQTACNFLSLPNLTECQEAIEFNTYAGTTGATLPTEIGLLTQLTLIDLWGEELSGSIPASLGNLTNLSFLVLSNNLFTGEIPSLSELTKLTYLSVQDNEVTGTIPVDFCSRVYPIYIDCDKVECICCQGWNGTLFECPG